MKILFKIIAFPLKISLHLLLISLAFFSKLFIKTKW